LDAVLLIQHGSVEDPAEIPEFVRTIRRGRPTPQSIIDEVTHRWKAIGGSPLLAITQQQAAALERATGIRTAVGARLWKPWARDVVRELAASGVTRVLSLPLAPMSVHVYNPIVEEACRDAGIACVSAPAWNEEPQLIDAFADVAAHSDGHLLFTAHSLPRRVIAAGDPYEAQTQMTASLIAKKLGTSDWSVAFQSQGMDGGDWLGPDLPTAFQALVERGARNVHICAIGFLADHTEILYDLDIEARAIAEKLGLTMTRAPSLNTHPKLIEALAAVTRRALT
jgi:protoporphyrin/coproporphyrin ferrochelatase